MDGYIILNEFVLWIWRFKTGLIIFGKPYIHIYKCEILWSHLDIYINMFINLKIICMYICKYINCVKAKENHLKEEKQLKSISFAQKDILRLNFMSINIYDSLLQAINFLLIYPENAIFPHKLSRHSIRPRTIRIWIPRQR